LHESLTKLKLGDASAANGDIASALRLFREAAELLEQRAVAKPESNANVRALAGCYVRIATCLAAKGHREEAFASVQLAQSLVRKQIERQPSDHLLELDLAWIEIGVRKLAVA